MIGELLLRFVVGGAIVTAFAVGGEVFQPKTFAGLFGAAPSVAIATLGLAYAHKGGEYVGLEAHSMLLGCAGLFVYSAACVATTKREKMPVWLGAALAWLAWAAVAFGAWAVMTVTAAAR